MPSPGNELNLMAAESHRNNKEDLMKIDHASYLIKLYQRLLGDNEITKKKYQQNLLILNQSLAIIAQEADRVHQTINRLGHLQSFIDQLQRSVSEMSYASKEPVDIHLSELEDIMKTLSKYYGIYIERQREFHRIE